VAEKLDYVPGVFSVERHIRGKWACAQCETIIQAPVAAHVIDKGIPTTGLLAQVLVAKYADHLPLYRQEAIFGRPAWPSRDRPWRSGWAPAACGCSRWWMRSRPKCSRTACCTPTRRRCRCSSPGKRDGKTHRAYLWAYAPGAFETMKAVVYDFCESRAGEHARASWATGGAVCLRRLRRLQGA
jgi:transposase